MGGAAVSSVEFLCSSPPPPWRNTFRNKYLLNGRNPQKRRFSSHEFFEARPPPASPSHVPSSPTSTRRCLLPSTSNSWTEGFPATIGESTRVS